MASTVASRQTASQRVGAERRSAAILIARLRNFTRLSDMLDAQTVLHLVGEFFSLVARIVRANGGQVIATHNDSLVAVFPAGAPALQAQQAVRAGQEIQVGFAAFAESWESGYGLHTAVALGAHVGETVFGYAGGRWLSLGCGVLIVVCALAGYSSPSRFMRWSIALVAIAAGAVAIIDSGRLVGRPRGAGFGLTLVGAVIAVGGTMLRQER